MRVLIYDIFLVLRDLDIDVTAAVLGYRYRFPFSGYLRIGIIYRLFFCHSVCGADIAFTYTLYPDRAASHQLSCVPVTDSFAVVHISFISIIIRVYCSIYRICSAQNKCDRCHFLRIVFINICLPFMIVSVSRISFRVIFFSGFLFF